MEVVLVLAVVALGVRFTLPGPGSVQPAKVEETDSDPLGGYRIVGAQAGPGMSGRELARGRAGIVLGFPHLVDAHGKPMSMARRAAFVFEGWVIFPQVHLLVNGLVIRVDALAFNGSCWKVLEFDGRAHQGSY